jgi:hypothetical protein
MSQVNSLDYLSALAGNSRRGLAFCSLKLESPKACLPNPNRSEECGKSGLIFILPIVNNESTVTDQMHRRAGAYCGNSVRKCREPFRSQPEQKRAQRGFDIVNSHHDSTNTVDRVLADAVPGHSTLTIACVKVSRRLTRS